MGEKNENIIYLFLYLFFGNSPTGQTRRQIFMLDGSNYADSREDVPFGGFFGIAPHFGGDIPQKHQFWGDVNRRFQAKHANIESLILSKLLHRFQPILHNDRDHELVIVGGPNRTLYCLRDVGSYLSKIADFHLPHPHLAPPSGVTRVDLQ